MLRTTKICKQCGQEYQALYGPGRPLERSKFCSRICANMYYGHQRSLAAIETRTCPICGKEYQTTNHHGGHKTCSQGCAHARQKQVLNEARKRKPKAKVQCTQCRKEIERFPSRIDGRMHFCSQRCKNEYQQKHPSRPVTRTIKVKCTHCGKPIKRFKCRINENGNYFCNSKCYLAHKGTSSIENTVATWLESNNLPFQQQVRIGQYIVDFCVKGTYIEVNGCYWHGCSQHCHSLQSKRIQKRIKRDKNLLRYCHTKNKPLLVIWEHDITSGNFESLYSLLQIRLPVF